MRHITGKFKRRIKEYKHIDFLGKMTLVQVVSCVGLCVIKFISFMSVSLPYDDYEWYA